MTVQPLRYRIYGLIIASDYPLPYLETWQEQCTPDIYLWQKYVPKKLHPDNHIWGPHPLYYNRQDKLHNTLKVFEAENGLIQLTYRFSETSLSYIIDPQTWHIAVVSMGEILSGLTLAYLAGPVLGFVLRLRGIVSLHSSAIKIDTDSILIVGAPGAGKSTTAATMMQLGNQVITDDVAPLVDQKNKWSVASGYGQLRLWKDALNKLMLPIEHLERIHPDLDKFYFDAATVQDKGFIPVKAIFYIAERLNDIDKPRFRMQSIPEAFLTLVGNTYVSYLLDSKMRSQEFSIISALVKQVPVISISMPNKLEKLILAAEMVIHYAKQIDHFFIPGEIATR